MENCNASKTVWRFYLTPVKGPRRQTANIGGVWEGLGTAAEGAN